ncbi:MAG TPA: hypothetical protein VGN68_05375 [Sphingopyxis sp.]|jgi:hypothetical protein|uniref:hypothetical protein n=1 Tax=Sphingopyxis sp. TaxID=1908224 RepID=UPI002E0FB69A|nr:hypothetical protein [Sphingopyxis sp.]
MSVRRLAIARDAPALRFLLFCVGGWTVLRVAAHWNPDVTPPPPETVTPPWSVPTPFAATGWRNGIAAPVHDSTDDMAPAPRLTGFTQGVAAQPRTFDAAAIAHDESGSSGDSGGADRHGLRAALIARLFSSPPGGAMRTAVRHSRADWYPVKASEQATPGQGKPFWMRRQMAGWSLGGWLYLRGGALRAPDGIAAASQLGGSQAGLRLAYGFGDTGRVRAYARATIAVRRAAQRELAFGLAFAPLAHWPVDAAIEQRVAVGREGRTALAAMVSGGVGDVALPHGFRLEAYGQAGVVGARRRDGFADGAVVIDHGIGPDETSPLRLGALAAGAVQPDAARVDVGPRLTLRLPQVGEGGRIALDWRQRIAGDARPASGLALTLASDF